VQKSGQKSESKIKIYLDEDLDWNSLIVALKIAGFEAISPRQVNMRRQQNTDKDVWDFQQLSFAAEKGYTLITANPKHFKELQKSWQRKHRPHFGILVLYKYNDPEKDMNPAQIAKAIKNIINLRLELRNQLYRINDFKY